MLSSQKDLYNYHCNSEGKINFSEPWSSNYLNRRGRDRVTIIRRWVVN